jgi:hypothetical protein
MQLETLALSKNLKGQLINMSIYYCIKLTKLGLIKFRDFVLFKKNIFNLEPWQQFSNSKEYETFLIYLDNYLVDLEERAKNFDLNGLVSFKVLNKLPKKLIAFVADDQ